MCNIYVKFKNMILISVYKPSNKERIRIPPISTRKLPTQDTFKDKSRYSNTNSACYCSVNVMFKSQFEINKRCFIEIIPIYIEYL